MFAGFHYIGSDYEGYEVRFARLTAARADVELMEVTLDLSKENVRRVLDLPRFARPAKQTIALMADDLAVAAAGRVGADCFMAGQWGDILFLQRGGADDTHSDYMRLCGFGKDFWPVAYDAATLLSDSIWNVLRHSFKTVFLEAGLTHDYALNIYFIRSITRQQ